MVHVQTHGKSETHKKCSFYFVVNKGNTDPAGWQAAHVGDYMT